MSYHIPVLLEESIGGLDIKKEGIYVDATFGGGGHSKSILKYLNAKGHLYGFDQDEDAKSNLPEADNFTFVHSNFRYINKFLRLHKVKEIDGLLADLGVSSYQIDTAERGFSYRMESELDMRMNSEMSTTAADILNNYNAVQLQHVLSEYGEVRNSKTLAHAMVERRGQKPFHGTKDFLDFLDTMRRGEKLKYYSQVFQALRIEVNDEMGALREFLEKTLTVLGEGARVVFISYHSLEDRLVKRFLKTGNIEGEVIKDEYGNIRRPFKLINKKVILPSKKEIAENPRARSAKMRIAEKLH